MTSLLQCIGFIILVTSFFYGIYTMVYHAVKRALSESKITYLE